MANAESMPGNKQQISTYKKKQTGSTLNAHQ